MVKRRTTSARLGLELATRVIIGLLFFQATVGTCDIGLPEGPHKIKLNHDTNSKERRFRENLLESFFLKSMRIELQKNKILEQFSPDELPLFLEEELEAASSKENLAENDAIYDQTVDDQEMIDFLQRGESPEEEDDDDLSFYPQSKEAEPVISHEEEIIEEDEDPLTNDSWIDYFRPMWRFCKDNYRAFVKEFKEQRDKLRDKWKYFQNEEDEDYFRIEDVEEFEKVDVQRKIVFLDEVPCEQVYGVYYSTSSPIRNEEEHLNFCLEFDLQNFYEMITEKSEIAGDRTIKSNWPKIQLFKGELWFYKALPDAMDSHSQVFSLTEIDNWDVEGRFKKFQILSLKQQRHLPVGWIKVDVRHRVMDWLSSSGSLVRSRNKNWVKRHSKHFVNHLENDVEFWRRERRKMKMYESSAKRKVFLNISCKTCLGSNSTDHKPTNSQAYRPFFMVDYKILKRKKLSESRKISTTTNDQEVDSLKGRGKRNLNCSPGITECCREKLKVDFSQIGWDWIILPKSYDAYFCRGSCFTAAANALRSSHNVLLGRYVNKNSQVARRLGITSCCTGTQYRSLDIVYVGRNNTLMEKPLPNMIVESCGCM